MSLEQDISQREEIFQKKERGHPLRWMDPSRDADFWGWYLENFAHIPNSPPPCGPANPRGVFVQGGRSPKRSWEEMINQRKGGKCKNLLGAEGGNP